MNNETSPVRGTEIPAQGHHQYEHVTPTVIHHPEEDMTLLGRWAYHAMQDPSRFWTWVVGIVGAVLFAVVLTTILRSGTTGTSDAWSRLEAARNVEDQLAIARENPGTPAASWALYQAGARLYRTGVEALPADRDKALSDLKKAIDQFDQLGKDVAKDSPLAPASALGKARALEARNELPKAVDQYKLLSETWPESPEAAEAKRLIVALQRPEAAAFYKELYAYTPPKVTLPPLGTETIDLPGGPLTPADATKPSEGQLLIPPPPPSSPATKDAEAAKSTEPKPETPPASPDAPKASEPKAEAPPAAPAEPAKAGEPKVETPAPTEPKQETPKN